MLVVMHGHARLTSVIVRRAVPARCITEMRMGPHTVAASSYSAWLAYTPNCEPLQGRPAWPSKR